MPIFSISQLHIPITSLQAQSPKWYTDTSDAWHRLHNSTCISWPHAPHVPTAACSQPAQDDSCEIQQCDRIKGALSLQTQSSLYVKAGTYLALKPAVAPETINSAVPLRCETRWASRATPAPERSAAPWQERATTNLASRSNGRRAAGGNCPSWGAAGAATRLRSRVRCEARAGSDFCSRDHCLWEASETAGSHPAVSPEQARGAFESSGRSLMQVTVVWTSSLLLSKQA